MGWVRAAAIVVALAGSVRAQEEDEPEVAEGDEELIPVNASFFNEFSRSVDIYWEDGFLGRVVSQALPPGKGVFFRTFESHEFTFTDHGTRKPLLPPIKVVAGTESYSITEEAVENAKEELSCFDRFPHFCRDRKDECSDSPGWMIVHCPRTCDSCDLQDPKKRCVRSKLDMDDKPIWAPGDLNALFSGIKDRWAEFKPKIHSQPPDGPWLVEFEDFVKDDEISKLIDLNQEKFERSTDQGFVNELGEMQKVVSNSRTSSNAWCTEECADDDDVLRVYERISNVTGVPSAHFESFQVLQYKAGQFYNTHHDDAGGEETIAGPRILTFFLYLSDVDEGGETEFPRLGIKIKPKKGSAILWPSQTDADPTQADDRMYHAALPVKKGVKYAANAWIHLYNYVVPNLWGCTGSFS